MRALLLVLCGCGASQFLVHVDTDAPVPSRPGAASGDLRWLFDQLRVEVFRGDEVQTRRDFAVDEGMFTDGRVSFGVAPPFGSPDFSLRLRLYRGDHAIGGEPDPGATLETRVDLPPLSDRGPVDLVVRLSVDNVGQPQSEVATRGTVGGSKVGSWPGGHEMPCAGAPGPGEACVPGGAFWMGDPLLRDSSGLDAHRERLVVVSPFFIDTHEVTVAEARGAVQKPTAWIATTDGDVYDSWCTYTSGPSAADPDDSHAGMAANCITYSAAVDWCRRQGKELPSEAQFEYVASGLGREQAFPWGGDEPTCDDAVWGWGGVGQTLGYDPDCRTNNRPGGVRPPGSGRRDRIRIGDVEVLDLAGNLSEWARDQWSRPEDAFWSKPGVFIDPVADLVAKDGRYQRSFRGGAFHDPPLLIRAASRFHATEDVDASWVFYKIGWRCVRPGM